MMEIVFTEIKTGKVTYAVTDVSLIRYVTPSEIGITYKGGRNSSCPFLHTETFEVRHIHMITQQRQEEIDSATKTNPVILTAEEAAELRMRNKHHFQMDVGAGKYVLPAAEGSPAAKALEFKDKGLSNAEIAQELGLAESSVRSILGKTYVP